MNLKADFSVRDKNLPASFGVFQNISDGAYVLPVAAADTLGGVQPAAKTEDMTQTVGVDEAGGLWTSPGGGSDLPFINKLTTAEETSYIEISTDSNGNTFDITELELFIHIPAPSANMTVQAFANQTGISFTKLGCKTDGSNVIHIRTHRTANWMTVKARAYGAPQYDATWTDKISYTKEPAHITSVGIANWDGKMIPAGVVMEVYGR